MSKAATMADGGGTTHDLLLADLLRPTESTKPIPGWLQRIDRWGMRWGDLVNPILVKETRQALKSRQFVATFSLLLFASLVWTLIACLQQMPQIYYMPSANQLVVGYYLLLAVPMLLVVPLAAHRSLVGEVDDGTLELLSITALSPLQIVLGKLASATLQMLLYFVVLIPCLAFAYTLRGVELSTLILLVVTLILSGLFLTSLALALSPVSPGRMGQTVLLLIMLAILLFVEYWLAMFAIGVIQDGQNVMGEWKAALTAFALAILLIGSLSWLFLVATAAKLTPPSENRSTRIRVATLVHVSCVLFTTGFVFFHSASHRGPNLDQSGNLIASSSYLLLFCATVGAMMCSESSVLTTRVRRELPATFLGRCIATWLTPGPATGMTFIVSVMICSIGGLMLLPSFVSGDRTLGSTRALWILSSLSVSYIVLAFVGTRLIMAFLSRTAPVKVQVGLAAFALTALLMALVPYGTEMVLRDYRQLSYSLWQSTNWAWTLSIALDRQLDTLNVIVITTCAAAAFFLHLLFLGRRVLPQRLVTPDRVLAEYRRLSGLSPQPAAAEPIDPLGLNDPPN